MVRSGESPIISSARQLLRAAPVFGFAGNCTRPDIVRGISLKTRGTKATIIVKIGCEVCRRCKKSGMGKARSLAPVEKPDAEANKRETEAAFNPP